MQGYSRNCGVFQLFFLTPCLSKRCSFLPARPLFFFSLVRQGRWMPSYLVPIKSLQRKWRSFAHPLTPPLTPMLSESSSSEYSWPCDLSAVIELLNIWYRRSYTSYTREPGKNQLGSLVWKVGKRRRVSPVTVMKCVVLDGAGRDPYIG